MLATFAKGAILLVTGFSLKPRVATDLRWARHTHVEPGVSRFRDTQLACSLEGSGRRKRKSCLDDTHSQLDLQ